MGEPEGQVAPRQGLAVNQEPKEGTRQTQQTTWGVQTKQEQAEKIMLEAMFSVELFSSRLPWVRFSQENVNVRVKCLLGAGNIFQLLGADSMFVNKEHLSAFYPPGMYASLDGVWKFIQNECVNCESKGSECCTALS